MMYDHRAIEISKPLSFSKVHSLVEKCPLRFRLVYIDGMKEEMTPPLYKGQLMHTILEKLTRASIGRRPTQDEVAQAVYLSLQDPEFQPWIDSSDEEEYKELLSAIGCLDLDFTDTKAIEERFYETIRLDDGTEVTYTGVWDRVDVSDGNVTIIDYKSSKEAWSSESYKDQAYIYLEAARKVWPSGQPIELQFIFPLSGQRITFRDDPNIVRSHVQAWFSTFLSMLAERLETSFEAKASWWCKGCPIWGTCETRRENVRQYYARLREQKEVVLGGT